MENCKTTRASVAHGGPQKSYISELYSPQTGRQFGYRIGGLLHGPDVAVSCQAALAKQVFQRLLLIPSLNRMKGRLFLISLDRLEDPQGCVSLHELLGLGRAVDGILTLPPVELDTLDEAAAMELVRRNYFAVLRLCARMGMVNGRGIPDHDAPLS